MCVLVYTGVMKFYVFSHLGVDESEYHLNTIEILQRLKYLQ